MKVKVSELMGAALDYAVECALGWDFGPPEKSRA